jgi:nucleotide-binding universal stress UspA family protein
VNTLRDQANQQMVEIEKQADAASAKARIRIEVGVPSQRIEQVACDLRADLIVLGTHGVPGCNTF